MVERSERNLFNERAYAPVQKVFEIPIGSLFEDSRNSVLGRQARTVTVFASSEGGIFHYDVVPNMVVKKTDLLALFKRFSTLPPRITKITELWSGNKTGADIVQDPVSGLIELFQEQNPLSRKLSEGIVEVLECEDDTQFVNYLAAGVVGHTEAWQSLVSSDEFVSKLKAEITSDNPIPVRDNQKLIDFLGRFPSFSRSQKKKGIQKTAFSEDFSFENFYQQRGNNRAEFVTKNMRECFGSYDEFCEFQRLVIERMRGIHFEFHPGDSEPIYVTGKDKEIETAQTDKDGSLIVSKGEYYAEVEVTDGGRVLIYPKSSTYIIPVISFDSDGSSRQLFLQNNIDETFDTMTVNRKNASAEIKYEFSKKMVNELVGLMLLYDLLMTQQAERVRPELLPFAAMHNAPKMTERRFFDRVENIALQY